MRKLKRFFQKKACWVWQVVLFGMTGWVAPFLQGAPTAPSPGDSILFIYVNRTWNIDAVNAMKAALNAMPAAVRPTVTDLIIDEADADGIFDDLQAAGLSLNSFCQVWDLRFIEAPSIGTCGLTRADTITSGCPTCDRELFLSFLQNGGHLYVQGENEGFCARNETVVQFITDATGSPIGYPSVAVGPKTWTSFDNSPPDNFATNFDTLTSLATNYPGQVPLGQIGAGKPLTADGSNTLDLLWDGPNLVSGNGKLFVNFDSNSFAENLAGNDSYVRNVYTTLSTCFNFQITKTGPPGPLCTGAPVTFTLCYWNTGSRTLPSAMLWDTLPTCFQFNGSTPPPTQVLGNLYSWTLGDVNPGASSCITINAAVNQLPPCP